MSTGVHVFGTLRCRWCAYSCPWWWIDAKGRRRTGFDLLRKHVFDEHPVEDVELKLTEADEKEWERAEAERETWAMG